MKEVVVLGGGDSINDGIDKGLWDKIKDKNIWSLNSIFKIMPYIPTRQVWVDVSFFKHEAHNIQVLGKKGVKLHCKRHLYYSFLGDSIKQHDAFRDTEILEDNSMKEISHVFMGGHGLVGIFALSLAIREEYDTIYLLGYDWGSLSNEHRKTHCYQDKIKELNIRSTGAGKPGIYLNTDDSPNKNILDFNMYDKEKAKIYNVSPLSHITNFEKIDYLEFFRRISNEV